MSAQQVHAASGYCISTHYTTFLSLQNVLWATLEVFLMILNLQVELQHLKLWHLVLELLRKTEKVAHAFNCMD